VEAEDPLSQLADIHLPAVISFWPPAPGWWLLAALVLVGLALLARQLYRQWQQEQRVKRVLAELALAYQAYEQASVDALHKNQAGLSLLYAINSLLKRVALVHHTDVEVAPLSGLAWLRFLDQHGNNTDFTEGAGKVLGDGEYRPHFDGDAEALCQVARKWLVRQYLNNKKPVPAQSKVPVTLAKPEASA
jgi:hypothetical protein